MPRAAILGALLLCACGSSTLPAPTLVGVTPAELCQSDATPVSVRFQARFPERLDFSLRTSDPNTELTVRIGDKPLTEKVKLEPGAQELRLTGEVPAGTLPVGSQDVRLTLADGREAVLSGAITVQPVNITGYAIDEIPDQSAGVPFTITIRAEGCGASRFEGPLTLSSIRDAQSNKQVVPPQSIGPFQQGVFQMQLTLDAQPGSIILTVEDDKGGSAKSNPFRVL